MAGLNATEIRVAGTGRVLVAQKNTAAPVDLTTAWASAWKDLGYTSADGVKFIKKDKLDPVDTWQTVAAIRYVFSDRDLSVKFQLLQINTDTLPFFFGGATLATDSKGGTKISIPAAPRPEDLALGIEFNDGPAIVQRFVIPRGVVTETDEATLSRTAPIRLGVTFTALTPDTPEREPLAFWHLATPAAAAAGAESAEG